MHWQLLLRLIGIGLISLYLMTLLGCSAPSGLMLPDSKWYEADLTVACAPKTNGELAQCVVDYREALGLANADRAALREWSATAKEK